MYSVRINTLGGIQKATFSSLVGCTINRFYDNDSIRLRTKLDGSIKFYSSTYSLLQQLRDNEMLQTDIYIDLNDVEIYSGKLQMQGEWNEYKQECSLPVEIYDEYTVLLRDIDRTFGFRNTTENTYSQVKTEQRFQLQAATNSGFNGVFDDPETSDCGDRFNATDVDVYNENKFYRAARMLGNDSEARTYYSGIADLSYSRIGAQIYVALSEGILPSPDVVDNGAWLPVLGSQTEPTGFPKMAQMYAPIKFIGATYSDYSNDWVLGTCVLADQQWYFNTKDVKEMISESIQQIDPSITMGSWDFGNVSVYSNEPDERYELTLEEQINILKTLFSIDWRIENGEFWFRTKQETTPQQPSSYELQPYQYIDRQYAKDWSNEQFVYDIKQQINETSLEIDTDPSYADFSRSVIRYDNFYENKYELTNTNFVLDIAKLTRNVDAEGLAVVLLDGAGFMYNGYGIEGDDFWVYNIGLSLYEIMKTYYSIDTPFSKGVLSLDGWAFKQDIDLFVDYNQTVDINVPYTDPFLVDFAYYLKSSYGDLKCIEMQTDLENGKSLIQAAKK